MKMKSNFLIKREKVNFRNETYNQVQDLCFTLFGDKVVIPEIERDAITIIHPVSLSITFDRNETKMYFHSYFDCNKTIFRSENSKPEHTDFYMSQSKFRVFSYEAAEKYLLFKKAECELIQSIEE